MHGLTRWRGEVFRFFFFFFETSVFCAFSRNLTVAGGGGFYCFAMDSLVMRFMFCHSGGWGLESETSRVLREGIFTIVY